MNCEYIVNDAKQQYPETGIYPAWHLITAAKYIRSVACLASHTAFYAAWLAG